MHVLITGGTGTIGVRLVHHLVKHKHLVSVLSRQPYRPPTVPSKIKYFAQWDGKTAAGWGHLVEEVDAIVNLAGAGIADKRWTDERKKIILQSRLDAGAAVVEAVAAAEKKPQVVVQASGVDYYGSDKDTAQTESSPPGNTFLADVCQQWEVATKPVEEMGVRRVVIRSGVVLDRRGGALPKMTIPFQLFAGGPVGSGKQWVSWIHYHDEAAAIRFLIENEAARGAFNLTAPHPVRNRELAKAIGAAMGRPAFAPAPGLAVRLVLGELANMVLKGQQVVPARLETMGFRFKFPEIWGALQDIYAEEELPIGAR